MLLRFSGEFDNEKVSQKRTDRDFTKKRREREPDCLLALLVFSLRSSSSFCFFPSILSLEFSTKVSSSPPKLYSQGRKATICLSGTENLDRIFELRTTWADFSKQVFFSMFKVPQTIVQGRNCLDTL